MPLLARHICVQKPERRRGHKVCQVKPCCQLRCYAVHAVPAGMPLLTESSISHKRNRLIADLHRLLVSPSYTSEQVAIEAASSRGCFPLAQGSLCRHVHLHA